MAKKKVELPLGMEEPWVLSQRRSGYGHVVERLGCEDSGAMGLG